MLDRCPQITLYTQSEIFGTLPHIVITIYIMQSIQYNSSGFRKVQVLILCGWLADATKGEANPAKMHTAMQSPNSIMNAE